MKKRKKIYVLIGIFIVTLSLIAVKGTYAEDIEQKVLKELNLSLDKTEIIEVYNINEHDNVARSINHKDTEDYCMQSYDVSIKQSEIDILSKEDIEQEIILRANLTLLSKENYPWENYLGQYETDFSAFINAPTEIGYPIIITLPKIKSEAVSEIGFKVYIEDDIPPLPKYTIDFQFINENEDQHLTSQILELLPNSLEDVEEGFILENFLDFEVIEDEKGKWIFIGWDKKQVVVNENITLRGMWRFEEKPIIPPSKPVIPDDSEDDNNESDNIPNNRPNNKPNNKPEIKPKEQLIGAVSELPAITEIVSEAMVISESFVEIVKNKDEKQIDFDIDAENKNKTKRNNSNKPSTAKSISNNEGMIGSKNADSKILQPTTFIVHEEQEIVKTSLEDEFVLKNNLIEIDKVIYLVGGLSSLGLSGSLISDIKILNWYKTKKKQRMMKK